MSHSTEFPPGFVSVDMLAIYMSMDVDSSRYSSSTRPNARPNTVQYSHYPTTDDAQHEGRVPITSGHRFLGGRHQGERLQNYLQEEDGHLYGTLYGATSRQREQRLQDVETRYREALGLPIPRSSQSDAFIDSEPHMVPREDNRNRPPPEGSWGSTPHHGPEMDTRPGRSRNGEDEDRNPSRYNASEGYSPFGGHHRYD
ncbi:hypothetical protein EX30DRAFT_372586 [Ascodesmis nigricans]|uniref:Uncharacterized protein n=1 Tax=Ascodesmis nigricans TaxID=341454 RepID=A0A4S2MUA8_9PEZI|nr:hypothetical protein EX30DRAFT_372586 [Ascodesmis nigricans]